MVGLSPDTAVPVAGRAGRLVSGVGSAIFEGFWPFCALGPVSVSAARQKSALRAGLPARALAKLAK